MQSTATPPMNPPMTPPDSKLSREQVLDDEIFLEDLETKARWWHHLVAHFCDLKTVLKTQQTFHEFLSVGDKDQCFVDVYNLIQYRKTRYWDKIAKDVDLSYDDWDMRRRSSNGFERVYRKVSNAWNADFSFLTRGDPAYKACRDIWWSHFLFPVFVPTVAGSIFWASMKRSSGQRFLVALAGVIVGTGLYDWEFNSFDVDLDMERSLAVLRTPDSLFSRECRLMLKSSDPYHWVLREFYEDHGRYFDEIINSDASSIPSLFPVEFPMPTQEQGDEHHIVKYIDKAVKDKDSNELDNLGLTKQQQEYLFYETKEFEGCYYLEEEYTKCMDRFKWKKPQECTLLKKKLNRCYYKTQFALLTSGERWG